jgi:hypothetical protein
LDTPRVSRRLSCNYRAAFPQTPLQLSQSDSKPIATNLRSAYTSSWNLTIEREIRNRFVAGASYLGSSGSRCLPRATPFACEVSVNGPFDGILPRNFFREPGTYYQNTAVLKNIPLPREGVNLQFRAEFYNLFCLLQGQPTDCLGREIDFLE